VDDSVFGIRPNAAVLHQAFVAQRANQRRGTVKTKTRGEVQGSTRKLRGQKYTGRARQGSARAPHRTGGGVVFGPRPRDYSQALPKKMRRLAIRSALSGKVADGQLTVIDRLELKRPSTRGVVDVLDHVGIERSALIVTSAPDRTVFVSARNLQRAKVLPAAYLNIVDLLTHRDLLMTEEAVRVAEGLWGAKAPEAAAPAPEKPRRRRAAAPEAAAVAVEVPVAEPEPAPAPEEKPARPRRAAKAAAPAKARPAPRPRRPKAEAKPSAKAATARPKLPKAEAKPSPKPKAPATRRRPRAKPKGEEG